MVCGARARNLFCAEPELPAGLPGRAADCWEPLCHCQHTGGDWPKLARAAGVYLASRAKDEAQTGESNCSNIFEKRSGANLTSRRAHYSTGCMSKTGVSPWKDIRGKPLDERGLAQRLKGYGIKSKTVRVEGKTAKGYAAEDFHDAWKLIPSCHCLRQPSQR